MESETQGHAKGASEPVQGGIFSSTVTWVFSAGGADGRQKRQEGEEHAQEGPLFGSIACCASKATILRKLVYGTLLPIVQSFGIMFNDHSPVC